MADFGSLNLCFIPHYLLQTHLRISIINCFDADLSVSIDEWFKVSNIARLYTEYGTLRKRATPLLGLIAEILHSCKYMFLHVCYCHSFYENNF